MNYTQFEKKKIRILTWPGHCLFLCAPIRLKIMANRTVKDAVTVKGTNPQYLIEKIIRSRIYESKYWKENCFALSGKLSPA